MSDADAYSSGDRGVDRFADPEAFCAELKVILIKDRISQARLAREAGMDRHRINHYLRGRRNPELATMLRLDDALLRVLHQRTKIRRRVR
jgi:transcriptional regulator with XRE-family HTH domain